MTITTEEESIFQLLRYPYFWCPQKTISFLTKVQDTLKKWVDEKPQALKFLNSEARKSGVLEYQDDYGFWNWGKGFTERQLDALTSFYNFRKERILDRNMTYGFDRVSDLVKAFRHRYVHHRELPEAERECLFGMLPADKYESMFDQAYESMWIAKFPRLLVFLWLHFVDHSDESWYQYYPADMNLDLETVPQDLQSFVEKFNESLLRTKSYGHLRLRYMVNRKIVEFYQLSLNDMHGFFSQGSSSTILHIYRDRITYYYTRGKSVEYFKNGFRESINSSLANCTFAFGYQVSLSELQGSVAHCPNNRIIYILTNVDNIKTLAPQLNFDIQENPVALHEFDNDTIDRVLNSIIVIGSYEKSSTIYRIMSIQEVENLVKGDDLNKLLADEKLHIFQNLALPRIDSYFLRRQVKALNDRYDNQFVLTVNQTEFLTNVLLNRSPRQIIYISDKCGIGKSNFIVKLAKKMQSVYFYKIVLLYSMSEFLELLPEQCTADTVTFDDIVTTISSNLCQNNLENDLISLWFRKQSDSRVRFEIFLDGLDEISEEFQELGYRIIELLSSNCLNLRVWITSRDYLAEEIQCRFNIPAYQLVPLKPWESYILIVKSCMRMFKKTHPLEPPSETVSKFKQYAEVCMTRLDVESSDLLNIPLHCQLVADLIMSADLTNETEGSVLQFFEQLNSSKVLIYIYKHLMEGKCDYYMKKYNMSQPRVSAVRYYNRDLHMANMARSATILAIELLFGRQVRQNFEHRLLPEQICNRVVLCHGYVQNVDEIEFCNDSFPEFILADFAYNVLHKENYLGIQKHDPHFQKLLWEKMLAVKSERNLDGEQNVFKHMHMLTMFIWLCNQCLEILPENCKEIIWFRNYIEWTKTSEYCLEQYKRFCNSDPHLIVQTNDLAVLLDPNIFMIFALSLGFKNSSIELLDSENPYRNAFLNRQKLLRAIESHQMTESQADSYIAEVPEHGN